MNNLEKIVHLPPVPLNITFLPESNQQNEISFQIPLVNLNSGQGVTLQSTSSQGCKIIDNSIQLSETQVCRLSYMVDASRVNEITIKFNLPNHPVTAAVNLRHINETITLSPEHDNQIEWKTEVNNTFSPKKIRYPLWAMFIYFSVSFFFLCFHALEKLNFSAKDSVQTKSTKRIISLLIYASFAIISFLYAAGRFGTNPWHFVDLYSDAANIASFAAAYAHPENFARDAFLSNPTNFQGYFAFHVPLIRSLGSLFGNYASAFVVLLFPTLLLTLIGYYSLGLSLFNHRGISYIFSLLIFIPVSFPVYEYYGASGDILPRSLFQALLPFCLLLLLRFINQPNRWWICSVFFLFLFYVHPVSGPSWLIALYFSYLLIMLLHFHKILWKPFFISLFINIAGLIPFVNAFFVPSEKEPLDIPLIKQILEYRLTVQTITVTELYQQYIKSYVLPNITMVFLWIVSIIFVLFLTYLMTRQIFTKKMWFTTDQNQTPSLLIYAWWIAILFASIGIPLLDEIYISATGNLPVFREIRRNLRYFLPLLWITFFYILSKGIAWNADLKSNLQNKLSRLNLVLFGLVVSVVFTVQEFPQNNLVFQNTKNCLQQGMLVCEVPGNSIQKVDFYDHVCEIVQPDELIFPDPTPAYLGDSLIPRYYCQRSIAYTYKDGSGAGTSSMTFIENWWELAKKMDVVLPTGESPLNSDVLDIAKSQNADYFIFIQPDSQNIAELDMQNIVFQNEYGLLYSLK